jgi:hypothetical protein
MKWPWRRVLDVTVGGLQWLVLAFTILWLVGISRMDDPDSDVSDGAQTLVFLIIMTLGVGLFFVLRLLRRRIRTRRTPDASVGAG